MAVARGTEAGGGTRHYPDLDLLRGVAAIAVVLYHFAGRLHLPGLCGHGYLAVDFFFVMSGFVIARAYGERLRDGRLGIGGFTLLRLCRFMPLVVLGTVLAAAIELFRPTHPIGPHLRDIADALLRGCFLIPTFRDFHDTTLEGTVFPLDGPVWSLFFELIGNVAFAALVVGRCRPVLVGLLAAASATGLVLLAVGRGDVDGGDVPQNFLYGFARVGWSLTVGAALTRVRIPRLALGRGPLAACLLLVLFAPVPPAPWNIPFDLGAVLVLFPAMVGAAVSRAPAPGASLLARRAGAMSFPLYAIHYPVVRAISFAAERAHAPPALRIAVALTATALLVACASWLATRYDDRARRRLERIVGIRHSAATMAAAT